MKLKEWTKEINNESVGLNVPPADISVQRLIDDGLLILYREIKNLLLLSIRGKLEAPDAKDLRDHLKLLFELREQEGDALRSLSDEQLQKLAKEVIKQAEVPSDGK